MLGLNIEIPLSPPTIDVGQMHLMLILRGTVIVLIFIKDLVAISSFSTEFSPWNTSLISKSVVMRTIRCRVASPGIDRLANHLISCFVINDGVDLWIARQY